jgi:hypothetical protein
LALPARSRRLAAAVAQLAESRLLRERISRAALEAICGRTWEAAFGQLAAGYELALARARRTRATAPAIADAA